jgi:glycosyltransferase involved in cell wall biosynthesis
MIPNDDRKTLLVFSQTFVPDPASVGQHMADVAVEMARRGHRVVVYTSRRGYENPDVEYPKRETLNGVDVRRLGMSSFGKKNLLIRACGTLTFSLQCFVLALFAPRLEGIFFSTSPPLIGAFAAIVAMIRRVPIAYWAMDLNPDQLIAMGKIGPKSFTARVLERVNRFILKRSALVVALDRFMADRLRARGVNDAKMLVMPPWPHEDSMAVPADRDANPFRVEHGLVGKTVIMYSGNHSPANPLRTLLDAAVRYKADDSLRFLFVGGGLGKREVDATIREHGLTNSVSLPYQPLESLGNSLGAADVHVVSLGENMIGIIHPCKIYGAMAVARPVLFLGPRPSHVSDLLDQHEIGWHVSHGDVEGMVRAIEQIRRTPAETIARMGQTARRVLQADMGQAILCGRFCDHLERVFRRPDEAGRPAPTDDAAPRETEVAPADERTVSCAR